MTVGRSSFGLAVFGDRLWAAGGGEGIESCEYPDAVTNTWMVGPAFASPQNSHDLLRLVVVNGQLWAWDTCGLVECLDPLTNTWVVAGPVIPRTDFVPTFCVVTK